MTALSFEQLVISRDYLQASKQLKAASRVEPTSPLAAAVQKRAQPFSVLLRRSKSAACPGVPGISYKISG